MHKRYKGRYFKVRIRKKTNMDIVQLIDTLSMNLGYEIELEEDNEWILKKGSKIATYAGLINWKLIFRRLIVEWEPIKRDIYLTYVFPWATNIGLLSGAAKPELLKIAILLGSKPQEIKFLRKR